MEEQSFGGTELSRKKNSSDVLFLSLTFHGNHSHELGSRSSGSSHRSPVSVSKVWHMSFVRATITSLCCWRLTVPSEEGCCEPGCHGGGLFA